MKVGNEWNYFVTDPIAFFITGTEEHVITRWNIPPTMSFTLGQPISVAGGQIPGLDAVVYRSPGGSVADIVDLNLTTLPLYTGPVEVGGLVRFQVIPEPSSAMLLAAAACGLATLKLIRRRRVRH